MGQAAFLEGTTACRRVQCRAVQSSAVQSKAEQQCSRAGQQRPNKPTPPLLNDAQKRLPVNGGEEQELHSI